MPIYADMSVAQFENANSLREYPFAEGSSLVDDLGREIPKGIVTDLRMVVPSGSRAAEVRQGGPSFSEEAPVAKMTSVHLSQSMVSVCFATECGGRRSALSVTVSVRDFRPYVPYRLEPLAGFEDAGGIVTFGEIEFPGLPETYRFDFSEDRALVHPCCVAVARPAGLRSFVDRRSGEKVSGDVRIDFSGYVEASKSGNAFSLSLSKGAASELVSKCSGLLVGDDVCGATPIRSINGIRPDEDGNIVIWFH